jgi:NADH-quinone oxidoreductase subunit L
MLENLWLVPALPLAGFLVLAIRPGHTPKGVAVIGVSSVGISALLAILIANEFLSSPPPGNAYMQVLWSWMDVSGFSARIALYLDPLSLLMMLVITVVGFFIHLYSAAFMAGDEGYARFFAYMNLFVASMLALVLADNLLFLYLGWEGVGLCSYLLIGFWYRDPANGLAARKAFVVTRVGDVAMAIGLFLLFTQLGTLEIQPLMQRAGEAWPVGSTMAVAAAALLLGGAVGKSAQLPLQTWLPDAMAGPTPVSALIHAATMVTAGVYLIARTHVLFALAPAVQTLVAVVGALTLLLAAASALTQHDIKRVLAYSTMSQIGYMFLALGVGAWSAAMFHFMTHAFFKALLFLAAGVVILNLHHEHDIFKMGGLREQLPLTFWTFLVGAAALAALPLITSGFYSKELILTGAWTLGGFWPWAAGLLGALLTAIYTFRLVFIVFFGEARDHAEGRLDYGLGLPLVVLAALSVVGAMFDVPELLAPVLPRIETVHGAGALVLEVIAAAVSLLGVYIAYVLFLREPARLRALAARFPWSPALARFWHGGWGFDWLYDRVFVRPFLWFARTNRDDAVDLIYTATALLNRFSHLVLSQTQTGHVRWYAAGIAAGSVISLAILVLA